MTVIPTEVNLNLNGTFYKGLDKKNGYSNETKYQSFLCCI